MPSIGDNTEEWSLRSSFMGMFIPMSYIHADAHNLRVPLHKACCKRVKQNGFSQLKHYLLIPIKAH